MSTILLEGYLYKNKKFRTSHWKKRWFVLRENGCPGRYALECYPSDTKKKLSRKIDLDKCEEVTRMQHCVAVKGNFRHVFAVKTPQDHYFLVTSSETDMIKWVNTICQVCGLGQDEDDTAGNSRSKRSASGPFDTLQSENDPRSSITSLSPTGKGASHEDQMEALRVAAMKGGQTVPSQSVPNDHPYILLRNCFVKTRPPLSQNHENVPDVDRNIKRQPSIPEEAAPPPPISEEMQDDADNLYKKPPNCVIYGDRKSDHLPRVTQRSLPSELVIPASGNYDTVPSRPDSAARSTGLQRPPAAMPMPSEDTYDHIRKSSRPMDSSAKFDRKNSLPVEESSTYDQVPTFKTVSGSGRFNTLPHRRPADPVDHTDSSFDSTSTYARPPARSKLSSQNHPTEKMSNPTAINELSLYDRAPNASASSASSHRTLSTVREDSNFYSKPADLRIVNGPVGARNTFIADRSMSLVPSASPFHSDTIPRSAGARQGGSQETITTAHFLAMKSGTSPQRRNTSSSLSVDSKGSAGGVEYIDIQFSNSKDSSPAPINDYRSRTLPKHIRSNPPSIPGQFRAPLDAIPDGNLSGIEYKQMDVLRTKALQDTKKEVESTFRERP